MTQHELEHYRAIGWHRGAWFRVLEYADEIARARGMPVRVHGGVARDLLWQRYGAGPLPTYGYEASE